jgi:hypothetical protein
VVIDRVGVAAREPLDHHDHTEDRSLVDTGVSAVHLEARASSARRTMIRSRIGKRRIVATRDAAGCPVRRRRIVPSVVAIADPIGDRARNLLDGESEAVAAAYAEHRVLDQLLQLVAQARVLGLVVPRQGADPAPRLDLEAERETPVGIRLVDSGIMIRPLGFERARALRRVLRKPEQPGIEAQIEAGRGTAPRAGALDCRCTARNHGLGRQTDRGGNTDDLRQHKHEQNPEKRAAHRARILQPRLFRILARLSRIATVQPRSNGRFFAHRAAPRRLSHCQSVRVERSFFRDARSRPKSRTMPALAPFFRTTPARLKTRLCASFGCRRSRLASAHRRDVH